MVSVKHNSQAANFASWEADLQSLNSRAPGLPMNEVLVARLIMYVGRRIATILERQTNSLGLSEPELRVLTSLFCQPNGTARPCDLQACAFQKPANLSRIGELLVRKGFVTRGPYLHSRRRIELRITEAGEAEVRQLLPGSFAAVRTFLKSFSPEEQLVLISQLRRLQVTGFNS
jgi:MarR family transcriptional repressor of emrRAB